MKLTARHKVLAPAFAVTIVVLIYFALIPILWTSEQEKILIAASQGNALERSNSLVKAAAPARWCVIRFRPYHQYWSWAEKKFSKGLTGTISWDQIQALREAGELQ